MMIRIDSTTSRENELFIALVEKNKLIEQLVGERKALQDRVKELEDNNKSVAGK
jgi:hypothetical protein